MKGRCAVFEYSVLARRRIVVAILLSLGVHALGAAVFIGSSLWRGWPAVSIDVEVTGMRLEDLTDVPLGPSAGGPKPSEAVVAPVPPRARRRPPNSDGEAAKAGDKTEGASPPRPTSVRSYAPAGSRVTALLRLDRLRGTPYAPALDAVLLHLPDRRDLLEGTGVDLFRDVDAILIATPNPRDARVTFLAVRHRLSDGGLRAALERGARATGRKLAWRTERGRPFAERRSASGPEAQAAAESGNRDQRLILLAAPHLLVVTPPAYRALILGGGKRASFPARAGAPDGGAGGHPVAGGGAAASDGGGSVASAPAGGDTDTWTALLDRIDAEDSIMPADAVALVSVSELFAARGFGVGGAGAVVPGTRGTVDDIAPAPGAAVGAGHGGGSSLAGIPVPRLMTATLGITPRPFVDLDAELGSEDDAARIEREWPDWRHRLLANPLVVLSGFSPLVGRVTLNREGAALHVHVDATDLEATRLLELVAAQLTALGR